jgi:hypothetical protein
MNTSRSYSRDRQRGQNPRSEATTSRWLLLELISVQGCRLQGSEWLRTRNSGPSAVCNIHTYAQLPNHVRLLCKYYRRAFTYSLTQALRLGSRNLTWNIFTRFSCPQGHRQSCRRKNPVAKPHLR